MQSTSATRPLPSVSARDLPFYRAAAVSLFLSGIGVAAANPLMTLFFVDDLHVSLPVASLYALTGLAGPPISMLTGRLSDRLPSRIPLIRAAALWVPIGWILLALSTQMWMAFAISVIWFSVGATATAQTFATVRDDLINSGITGYPRLVSNIRVAYALGFVIGPVFGTWFGLTYGIRPLFVITGVTWIVSLIPIARFSIPRVQVGTHHERAAEAHTSPRLLYVFVGICILTMSGETLKYSFLPIYMETHFSNPAWMRGAVMSTHPFMELMLIPLGGFIAEKFGAFRLLVFGAGCGVIAHLLFATGGPIGLFFLAQVFSSFLIAAVLSLGMTVAQELYPDGPGFATSVFLGGVGLSGTVGGLMGSAGVSILGVPHVYFVSASTCAIGLASLLTLYRITRARGLRL